MKNKQLLSLLIFGCMIGQSCGAVAEKTSLADAPPLASDKPKVARVKPVKMAEAQIGEQYQKLQGWTLSPKQDSLQKTFKLGGREAAQKFLVDLSANILLDIKRLNHDPKMSWSYKNVTVDLTTHDAGGLTQKDFDLATIIDQQSAKLQAAAMVAAPQK